MRSSTSRLFSRFVTRTRVPRGKVLWAAETPFMSNRSPLAVGRPSNSFPYQEDMPSCLWPGTAAAGGAALGCLWDEQDARRKTAKSAAIGPIQRRSSVIAPSPSGPPGRAGRRDGRGAPPILAGRPETRRPLLFVLRLQQRPTGG